MSTITEQQIQNFVTAWYLALDQHAPIEQCATLVADDVEMIFPEKTLHGKNDFLAWCIGGKYSDGDTAPGVFNIFFDESQCGQRYADCGTDRRQNHVACGCGLASQHVHPASREEQACLAGCNPGLDCARLQQKRLRAGGDQL
jgi:hypothetical protein